jgi:hypothetical protein
MNNRATGKIITRTLDADTPLSVDEQAMLVRIAYRFCMKAASRLAHRCISHDA